MTEKKTIKVNFCGTYSSFNKTRNPWINALSKYYNVDLSEHPDFLFYSCFSAEHLDYKDCVKIFFTGENVIPNFNECDYASGFDYIDFGDRYFRKLFSYPSPKINDRTQCTDDFFNRRFCNFIYSNATSGEGATLRQKFCKKLMAYKHVDCPGKVLNNMTDDELAPRDGDWAKSKLEFLKKYKFTVAFENSCSNGYTTEKLLQPLQSFSIPIYYGNPLVTKDFNPKAFINCNDYDNDFEAVIERVKELDSDPDKYLAMLRESPMQPDFDFDRQKKYEQWLVNIIEKGNKPFNKDPRDWQGRPLANTIKQLKKENEDLKAQIADKQADTTQTDSLIAENHKLKEEIQNLNKTLDKISQTKPFPKLPTKKSGNFFYQRIEKGGYVKTYLLGICLRKRPMNMCKFIDSRLCELEKRLKAFEVIPTGKIQSVQSAPEFIPLQQREDIEWTNTWIEKARETNKPRILIIGGSVSRDFRGRLSEKLPEYAVDFIGSSASLEDESLYRICNTFFEDKLYKYSMIMLNIGVQHGRYLKINEHIEHKIRYLKSCLEFMSYVRKKCDKIILLTTTPNAINGNLNVLDKEINEEIECKNELQKELAQQQNMPIIDLYKFVVDKKIEFRDAKHFVKESQPEFAEYIVSNLKKLGAI